MSTGDCFKKRQLKTQITGREPSHGGMWCVDDSHTGLFSQRLDGKSTDGDLEADWTRSELWLGLNCSNGIPTSLRSTPTAWLHRSTQYDTVTAFRRGGKHERELRHSYQASTSRRLSRLSTHPLSLPAPAGRHLRPRWAAGNADHASPTRASASAFSDLSLPSWASST